MSLKKGFIFIGLAINEAIKTSWLLKPTGTFSLGGILITLLFLIPILLSTAYLGLGLWGMLLVGLSSALLLHALIVWGEVASLATISLYNDHRAGFPADRTKAQHAISHSWLGVWIFVLVYPAIALAKCFRPSPFPAEGVTDKTTWLEASQLALPLISLEGLTAKGSVERLRVLADRKHLRFKPNMIKVGLIGWSIAALFVMAGIGVGLLIGLVMTRSPFLTLPQRLLATGLSVLAGSLIACVGIAFNAFVCSLYHTEIYRWTLSVEEASQTHQPELAQTPPLLSRVINR